MQTDILMFFQRIVIPALDKIAIFFTLFGDNTVPIAGTLFLSTLGKSHRPHAPSVPRHSG